jgi:hypothetical protein
MSTRPVCIDAFAALDARGLHSASGSRPWEADQTGPQDVRRPQVLAVPHPSYGKLMLPDRLAFSTVALMLSSGYAGSLDDTTGVCLGLPFGSLSTDLRYNETVTGPLPSPAIFSATLPSSAVCEITIFWKYRGPNRVFCGGPLDGVFALDEGRRLVAGGKAGAMVVVCVWAVEQADLASSHLSGRGAVGPGEACALLLRPGPGVLLDMGLETRLGAGRTAAAENDGREYFGNLVRLLTERRSGAVRVETGECAGEIALTRG